MISVLGNHFALLKEATVTGISKDESCEPWTSWDWPAKTCLKGKKKTTQFYAINHSVLASVGFYLRSPSSLGSYSPVLSRAVYCRCLELVKCTYSTEYKNSKSALKLSLSLHV